MAQVAKGLSAAWEHVYGVDRVPERGDRGYEVFEKWTAAWSAMGLSKQPAGIGAWVMVYGSRYGFEAARGYFESTSDRHEDRYWYLLLRAGMYRGAECHFLIATTDAFKELPLVVDKPKAKAKPKAKESAE